MVCGAPNQGGSAFSTLERLHTRTAGSHTPHCACFCRSYLPTAKQGLPGTQPPGSRGRAGEPQHPPPRFILVLVTHNNATSQKFRKLNFQGQMTLPADAVEDGGTQFLMYTSEIMLYPSDFTVQWKSHTLPNNGHDHRKHGALCVEWCCSSKRKHCSERDSWELQAGV